MLELEQAQARLLELVHPLPVESVRLAAAPTRVLAEPIVASIDLPPFDNSAMDGYAVRSEDVATATATHPVPLRLIGRVAAGEMFSRPVGPGECVRIFTGSSLPSGTDAVIMQEDVRVETNAPDFPLMLDVVKPWENIRFKGEDVKSGRVLLPPGERLTIAHAGLLAAVGRDQVQVSRQPTLGLIATGNELREPGQPLPTGTIYESNRIALSQLASRAGAVPRIYPLVRDNPADIKAALSLAFRECDAVATSGGASVGELDFIREAFEAMGGELRFWRVAIKPGKPFLLGTCQNKLLFGLPGNPVSAFVTFLLLACPALLKMQSANDCRLPTRTGILAERLENQGDRRHFVRVHLDGDGRVRSAGLQASHLLQSLARANGVVNVPPATQLEADTPVPVLTWWE